jgi:hypothetical protein
MKVISYIEKNTKFIKTQYNSLKNYLKNEFEYIIFYDETVDICKDSNIQYIKIPKMEDYSLKMNFILKYQIANPDKYLMIKYDMILIDNLDIDEKYKDHKIAFNLRTKFDKTISRCIWNGIIYIDMKKIDDIYYLDWCNGEEWLNRQLKEYEQLPSIYEIDFNRFDNYNTSNLYIIKSMKSYTWTINELPRNLKDNEKLIDFLKTDKRNHGELIYSEIYDNIYIHLNEINGDEIIIDF